MTANADFRVGVRGKPAHAMAHENVADGERAAMKIEFDIPDYTPQSGFVSVWEDGFVIATKVYNDKIYITANSARLRSLAYHLLTLAQDTVPMGRDIDYIEARGDWPGLEPGSPPLIIFKVAGAEDATLRPPTAEQQERNRALRERFNEHMRHRAAKPRPIDD